MKKFKYPLEAVLRLRREQEEERKRRLAEAQRKVAEQKEELEKLFYQESAETEAQRRLRQAGVIDLAQVRARLLFVRSVTGKIKDGFNVLQDRVADEGARRHELVKAAQARRALERLRERRLEEWKYAAGREERKALDEIGNRRA